MKRRRYASIDSDARDGDLFEFDFGGIRTQFMHVHGIKNRIEISKSCPMSWLYMAEKVINLRTGEVVKNRFGKN